MSLFVSQLVLFRTGIVCPDTMAAALTSKHAFASGVARAPAASRTRSVRVSCYKAETKSMKTHFAAAAAFAAAALLHTSAAQAGVIMEKPNLKKLFQSDEVQAPIQAVKKELTGLRPKGKSAPSVSSPAEKQENRVSEQGGDIDPRSIALPGALIAIAGGAFALTKIDSGFGDFFAETVVKNSNDYAGYEELIKEVYGPGGSGKLPAGTKKVKASKGQKGRSPPTKGAGAGTNGSGVFGVFGSKD